MRTRPPRPCAGPRCSNMLDSSYRAHARFCSSLCRAEAWRERQAAAVQSELDGRPARDGYLRVLAPQRGGS
jgi:hypothetical protein